MSDGKADAFFSAGNTGACMAAATLVMGRIAGVQRPAIATVIPARGRPVVLLDVGRQRRVPRPENLVQFAHMGAAYAQVVLGVERPTVGLLSTSARSPRRARRSCRRRTACSPRPCPASSATSKGATSPTGTADVVVTDGFTGNVALKLMEGLARELLAQVKAAMTSSAASKVAAAVLKPALTRLRDDLDPDTYGGAPLLGVAGVCIIGHGSSGPKAVAAALGVAATAVAATCPGGSRTRSSARHSSTRASGSCTLPTLALPPGRYGDLGLMPYAQITGVGSVPARAPPHERRPRANGRHVRRVDPQRTGISERRIVAEDETTSDLAARAGRAALGGCGRRARGRRPARASATSSPDTIFPSTACVAQAKMGLTCPAFDVMAACTGFVYALQVAADAIEIGRAATCS